MAKGLGLLDKQTVIICVWCDLGMIGIGEPATLTETTGALHAFNIPLISVTPHPTGPSYSNVLTTAPDMAGQARVSSEII